MNTDQIQANKPEGATHYREYTEQYVKIDDNGMWIWGGGRWHKQNHIYLVKRNP